MKSDASIVAFLGAASFCFASCGFITPKEASLNGRGIASIARQTAQSEGLDINHFKNQAPVYLPTSKVWYTCFEERGMLLAAGEQFTVFTDDATGHSRLHRDTGTRDSLSRERLGKLLVNPTTAARPSKYTR